MITSVVGAGIGRWTHLDSDLGTRASGHGQAVLRHGERRLRKHPVYGYVTPVETRALTAQDLAPAA
ncbi:hypothetical protein ACFRU3_42850 [Streptomyces sp. NPDC056910]|uniref:hypothetical protein n=1 Tax=Streptomyces sp. NPDC056910 TaxID=3345964 RepID=UPI0036D1C33D